MQAKLKNQSGVLVVSLSGRVDVETAEPFRAACGKELRGHKIVFDFTSLAFVGSQGLLPFLETLQCFYETSDGDFKFCGVGTDFRKLFAATPLNVVPIFETIDGATAAFYLPKASTAILSASVPAPLKSIDYLAYRPERPDSPDSSSVDKAKSGSLEPDENLNLAD